MLTWLGVAAASLAADAAGKDAILGWIEVQQGLPEWTFSAMAAAQSAADVRYELKAVRDGKSGRSRSEQSGKAQLPTQEPRQLSQTRLNISAGDAYCVVLRVFSGDRLVASEYVFPGAPAENRSAPPQFGALPEVGPPPPPACGG